MATQCLLIIVLTDDDINLPKKFHTNKLLLLLTQTPYTLLLNNKNPTKSNNCLNLLSRELGLNGQYRHDQSRFSTGHGISVLV